MNNINNENDWIDCREKEVAEKLHATILSAIKPLGTVEFDPIVLGQEYVPSRWVNQQPEIQFNFQYGPRYWTSYGLYKHEKLPTYENLLTGVFKELDNARWYELVEDLYDQTINYRHQSGMRQFRCLLSKQKRDLWLVANDQSTSCYVAYEINETHIELLGRPDMKTLNDLSYAPREPVIPHNLKSAPKRMVNFWGLQSELLWKFSSKLDNTLDGLLCEAFQKMHTFGSDVALLWSKSRFNDASQDENWTAIRIDDYFWESGSYFANNAKALANAPQTAHIALGVLHQLLASNINDHYERCYGPAIDALDVCGLYFQDGKFYFAISSSNGSDGPAYQVDSKTGDLAFIGAAKRLDETILPTKAVLVDGKVSHHSQAALNWISIQFLFDSIGKDDVPYESYSDLRYFDWNTYTK